MNEWEFTAAAAGWINELIGKDPQLPFLTARCERQSGETRKRNDLTLLDRNRSIVLTGEVKLPYNKDGGSPLNAAVVRDARAKARRAGSRFFFTWNVNEFVLWETEPADASWQGQEVPLLGGDAGSPRGPSGSAHDRPCRSGLAG